MNNRPRRPSEQQQISRREFVRLLGLNLAAFGLPHYLAGPASITPSRRETISLNFPDKVLQVLDLLPSLSIDTAGRLRVHDRSTDQPVSFAPFAPTLWNREHQRQVDQLEVGQRWAIVLHWFGDTGDTDQPLDAYLRGFDALRPVFNYETRTSAHFLVGNTHPEYVDEDSPEIGIIQTQAPDSSGTPYLASHLQALDYTAHWDKQQYFVRAFYQLGQTESGANSVLQDLFDSPTVVDPNLRSIAVEITGHDFDSPGMLPGPQKIANTVAIVWALMKHYRIRATDVLGHHEIQLGKSDPGKKFISLIRYYLGILAVMDPDPSAARLVLGGFMDQDGDILAAAERYFRFVRSYLVLIATAEEVYRWEADTRFWLTYDLLFTSEPAPIITAAPFISPLHSYPASSSQKYLEPHNHEGVDLTAADTSLPVSLIGPGICLYAGETEDPHWQRLALFRHRQTDGAEVVAVYGHLSSLEAIKPGSNYPQHTTVGRIQRPTVYQDAYLHFAIAYGAAWDSDLSRDPLPPLNAGTSWIKRRYLDPLAYLEQLSSLSPKKIRKGYLYD